MRLSKSLRRAARASRHEWAVRGRQFLFSRANESLALLGDSALRRDGHLRSLGLPATEALSWFRDREPRWFVGDTLAATISQAFDRHPKQRQDLRHRANQILDGKMWLPGHGFVDYTNENRWHSDVVLGVVAPRRTYTRIRYLDVEQVGDSKHVWEPNRFGWAYWLGSAYLITEDETFANKFEELTLDWFDHNPYPIGINYCSALEVAFRAYAWVWALNLFGGYLVNKPRLLDRLLHGIWLSCRHIESNLSYYFSPNTHLLGEAFGLYACGAALPELAEAERWRTTGAKILAEEAAKQLHRDGTHRELSSCYHLYTTDFYVQASLIAEQTGFSLDDRVQEAAIQLANRLAELTPSDGYLPQFNDCDGGRLTWFCSHPLDATPTLQAAGSLPDAAQHTSRDRTAFGYNLWMGISDPSTLSLGHRPAPGAAGREEACGHYDSGIVTFRNDTGDYLLFRSGPFGYIDCGHSHDAPTSFVLYLAGQPFVVDSGVGHYSQSLETRNLFRSARGKNILLLNGSGPSEPDGWFSWKRKTNAVLASARRLPNGFFCLGRHGGFTRSTDSPVLVTRAITVLDDGVVVVVDRWTADRDIRPSGLLTLDQRVVADAEGPLQLEAGGLKIHCLVQQVDATRPGQARDVTVTVETTSYSPSYGIVQTTQALAWASDPTRAGSSTMIFSRAGAVAPTDRPGEFLLDRRRAAATIRVDDRAELPATLEPLATDGN